MTPPKKVREFVKYANRKLHEIGADCSYVTMEELDAVVSRGGHIKVIEDVSGEDITGFVMARLVYDRARQDANAFDVQELQGVIMRSEIKRKHLLDAFKTRAKDGV